MTVQVLVRVLSASPFIRWQSAKYRDQEEQKSRPILVEGQYVRDLYGSPCR